MPDEAPRSARPLTAAMLGAMVAVLVGSCASPQTAPQTARQAERAGATLSPHGADVIACARCHDPGGWTPLRRDVQFDHDATAFPLSGQHAQVDCRNCHLDLRFDEPRAVADDCAACHVDVHSGQLGTNCTACHDERSFATARRDAHAATSFPLTGRHRQIGCEVCHGAVAEQRFAPLPTDCVSCHVQEWSVATPDHSAFPTDCVACHGMFTWSGARFDHAANAGWPLEGAHNRIACESCHTAPGFGLIYSASGPRDCIGCHQDDYDRVHPSLGFGFDCLTCHTLDTFANARWAGHDARFPIYSGKHSGRWNDCAQCHNSESYASVTCLTCHEHSRARMDDKHKERPGYSYTTEACLSCHPRGIKL